MGGVLGSIRRPEALVLEDLAAADGPFLQDADPGDVGEGLAEAQVALGQGAGPGVEQVHRADGLAAEAQR